jgi:hypothetical protein
MLIPLQADVQRPHGHDLRRVAVAAQGVVLRAVEIGKLEKRLQRVAAGPRDGIFPQSVCARCGEIHMGYGATVPDAPPNTANPALRAAEVGVTNTDETA